MKIRELFRRDIGRRIEEVVKVDDPQPIADELDEYVATEHIKEEMEKVAEAYQETINSPNEGVNVWVSGFFGSGKSSWAKATGYLLEDPDLGGVSATQRFFGRTHAPRLQALLTTIKSQAPTTTVLLNLATGSNVVAREGDSILKAVYRALLERLGYSSTPKLAELEIALEGDQLLDQFEAAFLTTHGKAWQERRYTALALNEASHVLHVLRPQTYPQPDSWAKAAPTPEITADWLAERALLLLERRGAGSIRLLFIVDEAGQYVARSVQRMLDLQGLAESFQKHRGRLWLVVTSQERLNDVVDSLESKQVELARAQARFPLRVDLLPSDIEEVTSKRVLDKTDAGRSTVRDVLAPHWNQMVAATRLDSPTRGAVPAIDEVVRLYPMLPYQIQLLIDAVSARRTQGGASPTVGGSNRTIIRHAQQLITHQQYGLGNGEPGELVTVDRSYDLLAELIPTAWRAEVEQVATTYGADSMHAKALKVIALCADVHALPMTIDNLAAMLHPHVAAESQRTAVEIAVRGLVSDDRIRETDEGFRLQSPEQKDWEQARRAIDLSVGAATRLRRELLRGAFSALSATGARAFPIRVDVDGENVTPGDIQLSIEEADDTRVATLRNASRDGERVNRITWTYEVSDETFGALLELQRSREMIQRRDTPTKTGGEVELLGEERARMQRHERAALGRLTTDLLAGHIIFRGAVADVDGAELRPAAQRAVTERLPSIYPHLSEFNASVSRDTCLTVLRTSDLRSLPDSLGEQGIGLLETTPAGPQFRTQRGPLATVVAEARSRANYGNEATGTHLERYFAAPPYGAPVEVIQTICAAAIRCGLVEVVHQGQVLRDPADQRLDSVLTTLPKFRAAAFRPRRGDDEIPLADRTELAQWMDENDWPYAGIGTDVLAATARNQLLPQQSTVLTVSSTLAGLGLPLPGAATRLGYILRELQSADDAGVVRATLDNRANLTHDVPRVTGFAGVLEDRLDDLRSIKAEAARWARPPAGNLADQHAELTDLLASEDLLDHLPRAVALSTALRTSRQEAAQAAASELMRAIAKLTDEIRADYADLDDVVVNEALRPLTELEPRDDVSDADPDTLRAHLDSAHVRAASARQQLDQLRAQGRLAYIRVEAIHPEPIDDEEGLDAALAAIQDAARTLLADGKQVKLQ